VKRILLDVDGVLCDFIGGVITLASEITGRPHRVEDVTRFDFAAELGLDPEEARGVKSVISNTEGWWQGLAVLPGAIEGVARLREVAEVYIVTSPWNSCRTWLHDRETWLKRHFDIPHSHVLACSAKHLVAGDLFVDDKTETCVAWDDAQASWWQNEDGTKGETFAVQWRTPHNRRDEWTGRSARSWSELLEWAR